MISVYKEEIKTSLNLSVGDFKSKVNQFDKADEITESDDWIKFNLKRRIGNQGIIRFFWPKISVKCEPDTDIIHLSYIIDNSAVATFFFLLYYTISSFFAPDHIANYILSALGIMILSFTLIEFKRVKKISKKVLV